MRGLFLVAALLPEALAYRFAGFLGSTFVRMSKRRQEYGLRMLRNAYPDETDEAKLLRLARLGAGNLFKVSLDMVRVGPAVASGRFSDCIDMSELVEAGLEPPWFGVTGHLGSWECGAMGGGALGQAEAHVTARLMKNPLVQTWLGESRRRGGLVIHDRRGGIRGVARALEQGQIAMQVTDQNQRLRGLFVPFFGELASTERAAATLAVRKGYPFLVAAAVRTGNGFRFKFVVQDILEPKNSGDTNEDIRDLVIRMNQSLERLILRFPEQYLWVHDRYRTRPSEGEAAEGEGTAEKE